MLTRKGIALTWPALAVGCALFGVLGYAVAQARREAPLQLTAEDRLELQELLHRYMFILDMMIDGPAHEVYWNGWYHDVYARTAKGWRFKTRLHVGGGAVGVPADLAAARGLWEREPTPAGSRSLVGASEPKPEALAGDPLKWLMTTAPAAAGR